MLTPKENALEVINWGNPAYIPMINEGITNIGVFVMPLVEAPFNEEMTLSGKVIPDAYLW